MEDNQNQNVFPVIVQNYKGLYEGMEVKNYKQMCDLLEESILTSNSKKAQHKEWQRYFDYEKQGQKYIITEIYSEPLPKIDGRNEGNRSEYLHHIKILLLDYLLQQEGYTAYLTINNLFELLGLTNQKYIEKNYEEIINILDICSENQEKSEKEKINYVGHFYQRTYKKLNRVLFDALRNLKSGCYIDYEEERMVCVDKILPCGEVKRDLRKATDDEINLIRDTKKELLNEFGFDNMFQVQARMIFRKFYDKLEKLLYSRYGIHYTFKRIKILYTHKYIQEALEKTQTRIEMEKVNDKLITYFNNEAENNYRKNVDGYEEYRDKLIDTWIGEPSPFELKKYYRLTDNYKYSQQKLAEYLLKI